MYILVASLLNNIIREVLALAVDNGGSSAAAGIASIVTFLFVAVFIFGGLVFINALYYLRKRDKKLWIRITSLLIQSLGAILYFYGNNIVQIFTEYGSEVGCDKECFTRNKVASMIASGSALLFFIEFPICLRRINKLLDYEEKSTGWFSASGMIATYITIDALFNTVASATADIDDLCNATDISINVAFVVVCIVIGSGLMIVNSIHDATLLREAKNDSWIVHFSCIVLVICFPLFLLTDNQQPLDCAFGCDTFASNQTVHEIECNASGSSGVRLAFTTLILVTLTSLVIMLFSCRRNTKGEGII